MSTTWEDVEIPQGSFIGWHEIGQKVTGKVVSFAAEGGTDFNQNPCPQIVIELTESALNFKEKGAERETIEAGEFVTITCGQANLKRGIIAAQPTNGDLVQIHYEGTEWTTTSTPSAFHCATDRPCVPTNSLRPRSMNLK